MVWVVVVFVVFQSLVRTSRLGKVKGIGSGMGCCFSSLYRAQAASEARTLRQSTGPSVHIQKTSTHLLVSPRTYIGVIWAILYPLAIIFTLKMMSLHIHFQHAFMSDTNVQLQVTVVGQR